MLRRVVWLGWGMIFGALAMWFSMNYHVLRTKDGVAWVPKNKARLAESFVDVRSWGLTEWTEHRDLVDALHQNNRIDIVGDTKLLGNTTLRDALNVTK